METTVPIRRALLSVSDKTGLMDLARVLNEKGVHLLASGGTKKALADAGLAVTEVSDYTGQPEILGGRVKTLHPKLHGGILARRDVAGDLEALKTHGIEPIDLVVVNLYPFEATVAKPDVEFAEAIENIDVGGPSLIRGAAKNHESVAVVTTPSQYEDLVAQIREHGGTTRLFRLALARSAFALTAGYDAAIHRYLADVTHLDVAGGPFFDPIVLTFRHRVDLRYGENPHQGAAFYVEGQARGPNLATARTLHGKELSFNNLLDLDAALRLVRQFAEPMACLLKHNNPCGAAVAASAAEAFERAYEGDPVSAFGGIVGLNRPVDAATAERMSVAGRFLECVIATGFEPDALKILTTRPSWKNSVRLLSLDAPIGPDAPPPAGFDLRRVEGGLLVQGWDSAGDDPEPTDVPTLVKPSEIQRADLLFAWKVCSAVKSNAIVLARDGQIVGVGAGQMSRLDSVKIALEKAGDRARGAVLASDAFFRFRDGPDLAAEAGVRAIIQPGGSRRDSETLAACDEHGISMILTGRRHFRH